MGHIFVPNFCPILSNFQLWSTLACWYKNISSSLSFERAHKTPNYPPSNMSSFALKFPTPHTPPLPNFTYFTHFDLHKLMPNKCQTDAQTLQIADSTLLDTHCLPHTTRLTTNHRVLLRSGLHTTFYIYTLVRHSVKKKTNSWLFKQN